MESVSIYTDGACLGNPGPGGWAALIEFGGESFTISGADRDTTNNRMELLAAIRGLEYVEDPHHIHLYTDSKYLIDGITQYINKWRVNGWKTAAKKPVKNEDLWQSLDQLISFHQIEWHWVPGHSGHPQNEHVDAISRNQAISVDDKKSNE